MTEESGRLSLSSGVLSYSSKVYGSWSVVTSDLLIVGEFTNDNGPFLDDYFFVFVTSDLAFHEASFYAAGSDDTLNGLSKALGSAVTTGLVDSTDFVSRIMWPQALRDRPLYDFREVYLPGPWRWLRRLLRLPRVERRFLGTFGGNAEVRSSKNPEAPLECNRSVVTEADDAKIILLLASRAGVPTTVHLVGGQVLPILSIDSGYYQDEHHAHVSTNIGPADEDVTEYPFEVFFTYQVVRISDPRDGSVLFEVQGASRETVAPPC